MPREKTAPVDLGRCPVHGDVEARKHFVGKSRTGDRRFVWRCPDCHAVQQVAYNHGEPAEGATTIGFCRGEGAVGIVASQCRRPHGHPADVHVDGTGKMWPARREVEA